VARTSVTARADEHRDGEHIESIHHGEKGRQGMSYRHTCVRPDAPLPCPPLQVRGTEILMFCLSRVHQEKITLNRGLPIALAGPQSTSRLVIVD